jgi:hypothetical protein
MSYGRLLAIKLAYERARYHGEELPHTTVIRLIYNM